MENAVHLQVPTFGEPLRTRSVPLYGFRRYGYWLWRRYSPGGRPVVLVKSRLNEATS